MKITPFLDEKINVYDSEMSDETIETYGKYYKNVSECNTVSENKEGLDWDSMTKVLESKGQDLNTDVTENLVDTKKDDCRNDSDKKRAKNVEVESLPCKKRKKEFEPPKLREDNRDIFCWRCHKYVVEADVIPCYFCPRVYHLKCVHIQEKPSNFWLCTECDAISAAENPDKISPTLSKLQKKDLAELLMFVLKRMRQHEGSSHYENPVDLESYPDYKDYIVKPMYLALLENNIKNLKYSSCESFLADTKWMVHNSYVFNTVHSELTLYAKAMMKNAKHECDEIINCPDCYLHANTLEDDKWFIEPCDKPHILVWARLKGFPYWPCKVMKANGTNVDVRFFGDHNKSLVPVECCYLYSKQMPSKQKKVDELEIAIKEASQHIKRLEERFHVFQYAPLKTMYNPKEEDEQRKLLLPYHDKSFFIKVKDKEKLFDPSVIKNIFEDSSPHQKEDPKEESKKNNTSELANALEIKSKKVTLKPCHEELSPYRLSSSNQNIKSPCNKPTIIIEDSDSDILSQKSFNHSKQPNLIGCEKLSSLCISNKARSAFNEKPVISASVITINHECDYDLQDKTKDLNCVINSDNFKSEINGTNYSTEKLPDDRNCDNEDDILSDNVHTETLKSDDKQISSTLEPVNCLPINNPSLDKFNNNHISDKLRINSNAKLINIRTDNPALLNKYLLKPMVVLQKLKDEVFRDYSNYISKKTEKTDTELPRKLDKNDSSHVSSTKFRDKTCLNFDLLNGNLTELVSLTEIDLDKDDSLTPSNLTNNKNEDNIESNDGLKSVIGPVRSIIKSEKLEDDDHVDSDYIERLSKSILESTLDYDGHSTEESRISCSESKDESCERILVIDRENNSLKKETVIRSNHSSVQKSQNQTIDLEILENVAPDSQNTTGNVKSIVNNACSVVEQSTPERAMNHGTVSLCGNNFLNQNKAIAMESNDQNLFDVDNCKVKLNNEVGKIVCSKAVGNKKFSLENGEISYLDQDIKYLDSNKECQSNIIENTNDCVMLQDEEEHSKYQDNFYEKEANSENVGNQGTTCDSFLLKETSNDPNKESNQDKETAREKHAMGPQRDSDCEIVKIVFPPNSKTLKPIGFKRVKTYGGVIKKVIKNGMLLASKNGENLRSTNDNYLVAKKFCSKKKFSAGCMKQLNISGNLEQNHPTSPSTCSSGKEATNLKNVLEKCADNTDNMEENKMMKLEIESILNKVEKIEARGKLLQVLREELEKFEEHCKKKIESYKNAYIEEMDSLYTVEKQRWIQETMNVSENESRMMVDEIKKKQWCILCLNEAKFHCCWSTSYCSEKCQLADWPVHMKTCTQYSMRIGDPDLRLSPELKKIFTGEQDILNQRFKDLLESDRFNSNISRINVNTPSCSSSHATNSTEVVMKDTANSLLTSHKSSAIFVQKNASKEDTSQVFQNPGSQVMKIVKNPAVYVSGMVTSPSQTKNVIHVPKQNPIKHNLPPQDQASVSVGLSGNNRSVLFTVPLTNRNNCFVSAGKKFTSNKSNGNYFKSHNSPLLMGGQKLIFQKSFQPTKVIKKKVPILAHKNVSYNKDNNNAPFMSAKPLYISMQNVSREDVDNSDGLRDPLEMTNEKQIQTEQPTFSEQNSFLTNAQYNKPAQSFLIVEKSGETSQYTYKIGFEEDMEKMSPDNTISPLGQKSIVCAVSPLSYPSNCNSPSTSTEAASTLKKN